MNTKTGILGVLIVSVAVHAQENYSQWQYYRPITINLTAITITGTVTNFPLLVRLNDANFDFSHAAANGSDVRFAKTNGTTHLPYQIEQWDTAGKSAAVWVLMDSISQTSSLTLRMYYGKSGAADSSNGKTVFDTTKGFRAVWHMNESSGDVADATGSGFTGTNTGTTTSAGTIGSGRVFNGSNQWITVANSANNPALDVNVANNFSVSAWFKANNWTGNARILQRGGTAPKYGLYDTLSSLFWYTNPTGSSLTPKIPDSSLTGAWHWVNATYDGANARLYLDGVLQSSSSGSGSLTNSTLAMILGGKPTSAAGTGSINLFNGVLDEIRLESAARDSNWIKLSYQTQKSGASVVTLGEVFSPPPPPESFYRTNTLVLTTGVTMKPDTPFVSQGTATSWSVSPSLPLGLTFNTTNGIISGTPTITQSATNYTVTANNGSGGTGATTVNIVINSVPVITNNPMNRAVFGETGVVKFGILATGTPSPLFRWIRTRGALIDTLSNGGAAPAAIFGGVTTDTMTITNAPYTDSGTTYKCLTYNVAGSAISNPATLSVLWVLNIIPSYEIRGSKIGLFSFHMPDGVVTAQISIVNLSGGTVWTQIVGSGARELTWNGVANSGHPASPGIYVVRVKMLDANGKTTGVIERRIVFAP